MGTDVIKTDTSGITGCNETPFTLTSTSLTISTRTPDASLTSQTASIAAADSSTNPAITVSYCLSTAAQYFESSGDLKIYPTPAESELTIYDPSSTANKKIQITITDIL